MKFKIFEVGTPMSGDTQRNQTEPLIYRGDIFYDSDEVLWFPKLPSTSICARKNAQSLNIKIFL